MTIYLSKKIKTASFLLSVLIVFLHSYNLVVNYQPGPIVLSSENFNFLLQKFISDGICRIAVPLFFMISGYLFFINVHLFSINIYLQKVLRRTRTVLLPFVIWSGLVALSILLIQNLSFTNYYFYKFILHDFTSQQWLDILFFHPINYQLWFLQVLYVVVLCTPLVYLLLRYFKHAVPLIMIMVWFVWSYNFHGIPVLDGVVFFTVGGYIAFNRAYLNISFSKPKLAILYVFWVLLIVIKMYYEFHVGHSNYIYLEKAFITVGVFCFWFSIDHIMHPLNKINKKYNIYSYSFFIFLFHEPTLVALKKLLIHMMGGAGTLSNFLTYIFAPLITIFLGLFLGKLLKRKVRPFYDWLTGCR